MLAIAVVAGSSLSATDLLAMSPFVRGDANQDATVDISDASAILGFLFLGTAAPGCVDAADTNDDGAVDISDASHLLSFLFLGGLTLPAPGPETCGLDPTDDALDCVAFPECGGTPPASVTAVTVAGTPGAYTFSVTVKSSETGCDQYADWWEVITPKGELLYRRVLLHSHVAEQPFTRSGGPVDVDANVEVIVRTHLHSTDGGSGYGVDALRGTVDGGFSPVTLPAEFATELESVEPLPNGCAF